ncbi:MAG: glycosyltransferase family 4 protein [Muribaculum sp.]|nr:glycosyltransferase family 4 protein [Muribaculum sp.]
MKNILIITAFPPNKETAGQNYTRKLIEDLTSEYSIDVIYWPYTGHDTQIDSLVCSCEKIESNKITKLLGFLTLVFPLFSRRFSLKVLKNIKAISDNYDILYFDFSQTFIYSKFIHHPCKIGMAHDVILQKYSRSKLASILRPWIKWSEKTCISGLNKIFTFSLKDKKIFNEEYGINVGVVPFFIDSKINEINLPDIVLDDYYVMYGAWNRPENQESLNWVLDNYPDTNPKIKIIGGSLPQKIKDRLLQIPSIEYLGFVDNPYPIIAKSKGLIAPLFHGAGVKVKAIESLALGTPVVGTEVTFEGLPEIQDSIFTINNNADLKASIEHLDEISILHKIGIQTKFRQSYILKTFKEQMSCQQ